MIIESKRVANGTFLMATNSVGMEVTLSDFGAGIYQIKLDGVPMIAGFKDYEAWMKDDAYHGKCVGRIAGRIPHGIISFNGKSYQIDKNEGEKTLHGGAKGYSFRLFNMDMSNKKDELVVDYYLTSENLEQGFPGEVSTRVRYIIPEKERRVRIEFKTAASEETPIDLTIHSYFNLGGEDSIKNDILKVDADQILTYNEDLTAKEYIEIPSFADLNEGKTINEVISNPYFASNGGLDTAFHKEGRNKENPHVILENDKYALYLTSSYDDVVIYTSNCGPFGQELSNGKVNSKHCSVAIEPEYKALDFQNMLVKEGFPQRHFIEYKFLIKE